MLNKMKIKYGDLVVEYEGSEKFIANELKNYVHSLSKVFRNSPITNGSENLADFPQNNGRLKNGERIETRDILNTFPSNRGEGKNKGAVSYKNSKNPELDFALKKKLNHYTGNLNLGKTGADVILSGAILLYSERNTNEFSRLEILNLIKKFPLYKPSFRNNFFKYMKTHLKTNKMVQISREKYCFSEEFMAILKTI